MTTGGKTPLRYAEKFLALLQDRLPTTNGRHHGLYFSEGRLVLSVWHGEGEAARCQLAHFDDTDWNLDPEDLVIRILTALGR